MSRHRFHRPKKIDKEFKTKEHLGDDARDQGDFEKAISIYRSVRRDHKFSHYRARLKIATMSLTAYAWHAERGLPQPSDIDTDSAHALCGELLKEMNDLYTGLSKTSRSSQNLKGLITEAVVMGVSARDFNENQRYVLYLSSKIDDRSGAKFSYDAVVIDLTNSPPIRHAAQIKTRSFRCSGYSPSIIQIPLDQLITGRWMGHDHHESLASMLPRELNGQATDTDIARLDESQNNLFAIIQSAY